MGVNLNVIKPYSDAIIALINSFIVPVLFAIAFLTFLWGVYKYFILGAAEEKSREDGRQFILWGLIGFVVILSVWGLVGLVANTFMLAPAAPRRHTRSSNYPHIRQNCIDAPHQGATMMCISRLFIL